MDDVHVNDCHHLTISHFTFIHSSFSLHHYSDDCCPPLHLSIYHRYEEKEFMKLWNTHVASCPPWADAYLPLLCEGFVKHFAAEICREKLLHNALLHFITMWDFGLLRGNEVTEYMMAIDRVQLGMDV